MKSLADKKTRAKNLDDTMQENAFVMSELGRVAWEERKVEKARKYMNIVVMSEDGKENGDLWALWYKIEQEHAKEEEKNSNFDEQEFKTRINKVRIRRGEEWCSVAKRLANWKKSNHEIV